MSFKHFCVLVKFAFISHGAYDACMCFDIDLQTYPLSDIKLNKNYYPA